LRRRQWLFENRASFSPARCRCQALRRADQPGLVVSSKHFYFHLIPVVPAVDPAPRHRHPRRCARHQRNATTSPSTFRSIGPLSKSLIDGAAQRRTWQRRMAARRDAVPSGAAPVRSREQPGPTDVRRRHRAPLVFARRSMAIRWNSSSLPAFQFEGRPSQGLAPVRLIVTNRASVPARSSVPHRRWAPPSSQSRRLFARSQAAVLSQHASSRPAGRAAEASAQARVPARRADRRGIDSNRTVWQSYRCSASTSFRVEFPWARRPPPTGASNCRTRPAGLCICRRRLPDAHAVIGTCRTGAATRIIRGVRLVVSRPVGTPHFTKQLVAHAVPRSRTDSGVFCGCSREALRAHGVSFDSFTWTWGWSDRRDLKISPECSPMVSPRSRHAGPQQARQGLCVAEQRVLSASIDNNWAANRRYESSPFPAGARRPRQGEHGPQHALRAGQRRQPAEIGSIQSRAIKSTGTPPIARPTRTGTSRAISRWKRWRWDDRRVRAASLAEPSCDGDHCFGLTPARGG